MKKIFFLAIIILIALVMGCQKNEQAVQLSPNLPEIPYDYETVPKDIHESFYSPEENPMTNDGATLGRVLFYDSKLSLNNTVSCGTCHKQSKAFADGKALSTGFGGRKTRRSAPAIVNLSQSWQFFWDGRTNSLEDLSLEPVENHIEMGMEDMNDLVEKLSKTDYYPDLFEKAYGVSTITPHKISKAMAQFVRSISSVDSKYDRFMDGEGTLSSLENLGFDLFMKWDNRGCVTCHGGNNFKSDFSGFIDFGSVINGSTRTNIGLDLNYDDNGIGEIEGSEFDGAFVIPTLRNVALTGPYMHDGRFETLEEVIDHYDHGVKHHENLHWMLINSETGLPNKRNFSALEKKALVAFLHTLTDEKMLTDEKYSNPFR